MSEPTECPSCGENELRAVHVFETDCGQRITEYVCDTCDHYETH